MKAVTCRLLAQMFLAVALAACSGSIGLKRDFAEHNFEVGRTTRSDVVAQLGLPQQILNDEEGREQLFYEAWARDVGGTCSWCGGMMQGNQIASKMKDSKVKNGAEYVFDAGSLLVAKFEPKPRKK
jgi:hypothetical protein